jgi:hypothetical protein
MARTRVRREHAGSRLIMRQPDASGLKAGLLNAAQRVGVVELEHPGDHCDAGMFSKLRESHSERKSG